MRTLIRLDAGVVDVEEDSEEEDLFVRQLGELKERNGFIDLIEETEAASAARFERIGPCVIDLKTTST